MNFEERIIGAAAEAEQLYHRLVVIPVRPGTSIGPTLRALAVASGWAYLDVGCRVSEALLDLPPRRRALRAPSLVADFIREAGAKVVVVDRLDVLFLPELQVEPLQVLQLASRETTVVAAWPGTVTGTVLSHAEPGHPEFQKYDSPKVLIVPTPSSLPVLAAAQKESQ